MMDLETDANQSCSYKENSAFHSHYLSLPHFMLHPANTKSMERLPKLENRKTPKCDYYEEKSQQQHTYSITQALTQGICASSRLMAAVFRLGSEQGQHLLRLPKSLTPHVGSHHSDFRNCLQLGEN